MKEKFVLAIGFCIGIWLAYWLKAVGASYLWILFYR